MEYKFKTKPFNHQLKTFEETKDLEAFAVFWEQGTGKTKLAIDTICYQYQTGKITGVLIVAPNGVHRNWIIDEFPTHAPDHIFSRIKTHFYQTEKAGSKDHKRKCQELLDHEGLPVLAITYDGIKTVAGKTLVWKFLRKFKVFYVLDESARIKTPRAKRSIAVVASGKYAHSRRILSGTPIANSPFDIYMQMKFVSEDFWFEHKLDSFTIFKNYFGIFKRETNHKAKKDFDMLVGYRNIEKLEKILKKISSRVKKEDVLDLPEKVYTKRYFQLTNFQRDLYETLKEEYMAFVGSGELVTAPLAITRLIRFQQVISGYVPTDEGEMHIIEGNNPRLQTLEEIIEDIPETEKVIIWARFTKDIDQIIEKLKELGRRPVRYDGKTNDQERADAIARFQGKSPIMKDGERVGWKDIPLEEQATDFVGNPTVAGEGLTLHAASNVVYYNNSYKLTDRLQSEDRAHRIGQTKSVRYIDIVAEDSVDEHIVNALRKKQQISSMVLGDKLKEWI